MSKQNDSTEDAEWDRVHCLACDDVFHENKKVFVEVCPLCGNTDTQNTVYLQPTEEA